MSLTDLPPTFEGSNLVELISVEDSKIVNVSLYSGRSEITRMFKIKVKMGQNQVRIAGLPRAIDEESLRIEGRGPATIHDVTVSHTIPSRDAPISADRDALVQKKDLLEAAIDRCRISQESIATYLRTLNVEHVDVSKLAGILESYEVEGGKLAERLVDLRKEMRILQGQIRVENSKTSSYERYDALNVHVVVGVSSEKEGEVEIALIYAVQYPTWRASYDIIVDMQAKEKPVKLIYKAAITQSTGEDWNDVPLTLETASPTFGVGIPDLQPWRLSVYEPVPHVPRMYPMNLGVNQSEAQPANLAPYRPETTFHRSSEPEMEYRGLDVSSNGTVSATFSVPGLITIPSDGHAHNVTIVQLELKASLSWIAVPNLDTRTRLSAKIKNASEYTLLSGTASVYVDGSFIAKSRVPSVSPQESFDCPLGLDPSIRITYPPQIKKTSQSGLYQKTTTHSYTQHITIHNTKTTAIENLKIVDRFPVSQDSGIVVKYLTPALSLPSTAAVVSASGGGNGKSPVLPPNSLLIAKGIVAQWDGADDPNADLSAIGKDGKLNWLCSVPAQEKVNLVLRWDVVAPASVNVAGL